MATAKKTGMKKEMSYPKGYAGKGMKKTAKGGKKK